MTESYMKNGSFTVKIPVGRKKLSDNELCLFPKQFEQIDQNTYIVNMLNQHELADGWTQVLPYPRSVTRKFKNLDENGVETTVERTVKQLFKMRVNLAQLPHHLWHKMKRYNDFSYVVKNRIYHYLVENTAVDNEIRELVYLTSLEKTAENKEKVKELLNVLKDNDVYGWVVIRARNYIHV